MFLRFSSCTNNSQSVSCQCFLHLLAKPSRCGSGNVPVPRRACGTVDARLPSCRAGISVFAGWPCCCSGRSGSCVVSDRVRHVALRVDVYLSQRICSRSAVDFRVGHLGICLIRVAIGRCCSSGWGLCLLEILTVVPELSAPERGSGSFNLLTQFL
jgi:hypothetical protein